MPPTHRRDTSTPSASDDAPDEVGRDHTHRAVDGSTSAASRPRVPRALRLLLPAVLIVVWIAVAGVGGPYFGRIDEVSSNDRTAYLPDSAEATRVAELSGEFSDSEAIPAILVITSESELTEDQLAQITEAATALDEVDGVSGDVSPPIPSEDGLAVQVFVPLDAEADLAGVVEALDAQLAEDLPEGMTAYVTGPAGFSADLSEAFAGIDGILLLVALAAVLVILIVVYRSLLLPLIVLSTSMVALTAALLVIWQLANAGVLLLNGQTQGILFILVIGAATDYSLLLVARYRDELLHEPSRWIAGMRALRGTVEPVAASGGTVIAGLLCLALSDLKSTSTLGPVTAIGIVFAMLAALTFLPAVLMLLGRVAFWPRMPKVAPGAEASSASVEDHGLWGRIARWVAARPRPLWIITALALAIGCLGLTQLDADGVPQSELVLGASAARDGQEALGEHFPAGQGTPAQVLTPEDELQDTAEVLLDSDGVDSVSVVAADSASGSAAVTAEGIQAVGAPDTPTPEPTVVDGQVLLEATLTDAPDSAAAEATVQELRSALDAAGLTNALVGGETATDLDTNTASVHDRTLIIPIVLVVILAILMLLLRAVIAPLLLIAATVLSFGTALGVSAVIFEVVLDFPGADPSVPLFGFVFLVALGIDYTIFLMTRVREEARTHGTAEGVQRGLAVTGGVITSAGIVLAATFAALGVIPILFLAQLAVIVALGVLLDTLVVRTMLVPALSLDIGRAIWWPSKLARREGTPGD